MVDRVSLVDPSDDDKARLRILEVDSAQMDIEIIDPDANAASPEKILRLTIKQDFVPEDGKSAYEIALANSFLGTEVEWLESLKGEPGDDAYTVAVEAGFEGPIEDWLESLKGEKGDQGHGLQIIGSVDSAPNLPYVGNLGDVMVAEDSHHLWAWSGSTWIDLGPIQGDQGEKGDTGEQGIQGPQGIQGVQGPQGIQGIQGEIGPQGIEGPAGPAGAQGPQGPQGQLQINMYILGVVDDLSEIPVSEQAIGAAYIMDGDIYIWDEIGNQWVSIGPYQGQQGEQGPMGPQGEPGLQGPTGPQGPQGDVGPAGPEGPMGPQGIQGEQGPRGYSGDGLHMFKFRLHFTGAEQEPLTATDLPNGWVVSFATSKITVFHGFGKPAVYAMVAGYNIEGDEPEYITRMIQGDIQMRTSSNPDQANNRFTITGLTADNCAVSLPDLDDPEVEMFDAHCDVFVFIHN